MCAKGLSGINMLYHPNRNKYPLVRVGKRGGGRMGPGHDSGMMLGAHFQMLEKKGEGLNPRYFRQKAVSFVGIGGSDWAVRCETDHAMLALSPGWKARWKWWTARSNSSLILPRSGARMTSCRAKRHTARISSKTRAACIFLACYLQFGIGMQKELCYNRCANFSMRG